MLATALLVCAWPSQSDAQTKVAVIDFQNALLETADMQKESAALESKYQERQAEIERLSAELQEIQAQLQSAQGPEAARLQQEGQHKQRSAQRQSEDLQSDVEFDRQNILAGASARMRDVIRELRMEKQIDLIVDGSSVLAHNALIDLTAEATQAYDARHPAN
jgi:Skp family chaperone for outer membrane proteins